LIASAIREFAVSKNPQLIAAAYFEKTIQIWNPLTQEQIDEISTIYSFGARNLAFSPDARLLIAGRSTTSGKVAAYEVPSGRMLWEQKLIYPSRLKFSLAGDSILCSVRQSSTVRLDSQTGAVLERLRGVEKRIEGACGESLDIPAREDKPIRLLARSGNFDISKAGFAVLDAQFSPDAVCLTEANGPVRCFSSLDGQLKWLFDPGNDHHVLRVHYSPRLEAFFGTLWDFKTARRHLLKFGTVSGACQQICELNSWEDAFLDATDQLITSAGEIIDLASGEIAGRVKFPQTEYPDD
jgi:WD40 repeat protein